MPLSLTPRHRAHLKARAHALDPVVQIGTAGASEAAIAEVDRALAAHGLIKVKLAGADREARQELSETLRARTGAAIVRSVGRVVVLWRPRPDDQPLHGCSRSEGGRDPGWGTGIRDRGSGDRDWGSGWELKHMMRVAALYDIHGNLPALDAVLREVRDAGAERIVVGGDVLPGPMPRETLERLFDCGMPVQFIYGNGEVAVLERLANRDSPKVPPPHEPLIHWTAQQVRDYQQALSSWPMTLRVAIEGLGGVLFCHATPRNEDDIFTPATPEERLRPVFDPANASVVVCGHTHLQFDRTIGPTRVVNAGSVGLPFCTQDACWLLLGPGVDLRRTRYDVPRAADLMRATGSPNVEEFFVSMLLQPPSEARALEMYASAELT